MTARATTGGLRRCAAGLLLAGCVTGPGARPELDCTGVSSGFPQTLEGQSALSAALKHEVIGPLAAHSLVPPGKSVLVLRIAPDGRIVGARLGPEAAADPALLEVLRRSRLPSPCGTSPVELQVPLNARP